MTVTLAEAVIMDVARGLGCQPDNESILKIHKMKADYLRLRDAAQKANRHAEKMARRWRVSHAAVGVRIRMIRETLEPDAPGSPNG